MPLSPIDVQQQTFKVALRGYAEDEVDEFLDEVVISLRDYDQKLRDAQERIAILEEQLAANRETEDAMRRTFLAAQRTADSIVEEAKAESERLLADARSEVERVTFEQTEEKAGLLAETALLRDRVHGLRASLADLARNTLDRLDAIDTDSVADSIAASQEKAADVRDRGFREPHPEFEPEDPEPFPTVPDTAEGLEEAAGFEDTEDDADGFEDVSDDEPSEEAEIAKVPDWMTRDDEPVEDEPEHREEPEYRRPWERDDR